MPCLAWTQHLSFGARSELLPYDQAIRRAILRYLEDMLRPFGVPYRPDCFDSGNQNCYSYLAEQLLACLPAACTQERDGRAGPGLLVIAHATADCQPGRSLSGYLTTLLPGEPLCFAISDQGELAPFSALEAMRGFMTGGWPSTALVLVLDQSTLPYAARPEPDGPPADHAVGLLFTSAPASAPVGASRPLVAVRQRSGIRAGQLRATLAEMVGDLPPLCPPTGHLTLLAGAGLLATCEPESLARLVPAPPSGLRLRPVPAGPPCVGPWASLASLTGDLTGPADDLAGLADDRVLVIEYDQALAAVGLAAFDPVGQPCTVTPALEVIA